MPYKILKVKKCFKVINSKTSKVHARCSTRENAKRQVRLLNSIKKLSQ